MKKTYIFGMAMIIALAFASCGSKKEIVYVQQPTSAQPTNPKPDDGEKKPGIKLYKPCYEESRSDKEFFRELGVFSAADKGEARKGALLQANQLLRNRLGGLVNGIAEDYLINVNGKTDKSVQDMLEESMNIAVVKVINDADNPCEDMYEIEGGKFEAYYTIEISKEVLVDKMAEEIANNEELNLRFKREKFTERAKTLTERYK